MPFSDVFLEVYEMLKGEFGESFEFSNAGEEGNPQNILKDIIQPIFESAVLIADLTGLNSNVLYELGIAHALNKKTIIITQDNIEELPFDLKSYRVHSYSTHFKKFTELVAFLKRSLLGAIDDSVSFSNPVKDFLSTKKNEQANWFEEPKLTLKNDSDKGFIDFLAEIEEDAETITREIGAMSTDMTQMTEKTNRSTSEIERVKKTGGSGTAGFARKELKKVAGHIDTFSRKLKEHNRKNSELWDRVEKNTFGLIENKFAATEENRPSLIDFFRALKGMQEAVAASRISVGNLKSAMHNNLGFESSLNQAIRFVEEDLASYIDFALRLCSSIDRILDKSRFLVGEIDFSKADG